MPPIKALPLLLGLLVLGACASGPEQTTLALPAPPPEGEPGGFIGMTASALRASFGAPSFTRRESGSELWRYDTAQCRAFFFLYPAGREMGVRHVETTPHGPREAADMKCLTALRAKPATPSS